MRNIVSSCDVASAARGEVEVSFGRSSRGSDGSGRGPAASGPAASPGPGKQTLTAQLDAAIDPTAGSAHRPAGTAVGVPTPHDTASPIVQQRAARAPEADVHAAAAHGTRDSATALPHRAQIQQAFGRHDVGHIQAHIGGAAAEGAAAMGATAFAVGHRVAFGEAPDLHTAAHEAAHVVQQRAGVQLRGGVGEAGDRHEQHADAVADLVVQGRSAEAVLDQYGGGASGAPGGVVNGAVQRHAFINGKQVLKSDKFVTATMLGPVTDDLVRNYESPAEFQRHLDKKTDYIGNLDDPKRTWLRFHQTGLNLIGEVHQTEWSLEHILAAVNGKSFISEAIASEDPPAGSQLKAAYDARNADRYKELGIEKEKDKSQYGAEPLPPKLGYTMTALLPYLNLGTGTGAGDRNVHRLAKGDKTGGVVDDYRGELYLGMLKMSWAYAMDARNVVMASYIGGVPVPPRLDALAQVVEAVRGEIGPYITGLPVHGWLGDTLAAPANARLLPPLVRFVQAMIDMLTESAVSDPGSGLDARQQKKFSGTTTSDEKQQMFLGWRNHGLHRAVVDAAARRVRYASFGFEHIAPLVKAGLPPEVHTDDDDSGPSTAELKAIAVKQPP
jgi:hypothetical protein